MRIHTVYFAALLIGVGVGSHRHHGNLCTLRITIVGDSNGVVAGGMPPESKIAPNGHTWIQLLRDSLLDDNPQGNYILSNRSVAGEASRGLAYGDTDPPVPGGITYTDPKTGKIYSALPPEIFLSEDRPDIFILMVGTNDAIIAKSEEQRRTQVDQFTANFRYLISKVTSVARSSAYADHNTRLILMTPLPAAKPEQKQCCGLAPMHTRDPETLEQISKIVLEVGRELSAQTVDIHSIISKKAGWLYFENKNDSHSTTFGLVMDGVHASESGRKIIAAEVSKAIQKILPAQCR